MERIIKHSDPQPRRRSRARTRPVVFCAIAALAMQVASAGAGTGESRDVAAGTGDISERSTLDDCLAYAALHSPNLESSYHRWQAALERVAQAESLPDPTVSYAYYIESVETRVGPQEHMAGFKQTVPWLGKLSGRGDLEARSAQSQFERYQAAKLELFYQVKNVYYELYYLRSAIELTRDNMELLGQFERIARAKYRVAAASHPDVVRVQVELGRLEDRLRALEDMRRPLAARMNAALDRPADAAVPWPREVVLPELAATEDELFETAKRDNPNIRALESETERERVAERLADLDFLPDFTFGVDYIFTGDAIDPSMSGSGDDAVIGRVSFSLPLWYEKYSAAQREATARRTAMSSRRADATNELVAALQQALYELHDAQRKIELFRDSLIPKAEESLRASLRGFEGGGVSFLDLLDAERVLLEFQLLERRARSHHGQALARLEMLAGVELSDRSIARNAGDTTP